MKAYWRAPVAFGRDVLRVKEIDDFQREIAIALLYHQRVAVSGAKGIGKGFIAAILIWWYLATRPEAKVAITSASATTVQTNIWTDLARFYEASPWLREFFEMGDRMIRSRRHPKSHFAIARQASVRYTKGGRAKERQAEALSGMYTKHVLWVVDEATAIDDAICNTIDTSVNQRSHRLLALFNPIRTSGWAWRIFNVARESEGWVRIKVPYHRSHIALANSDERDRWVRKWGENSALVRAWVYGEFPDSTVGDAAYNPGDLFRAFMTERGASGRVPLDIGIDPARHGTDECVLLAQRDNVGLEMRTFPQIKQDELIDAAEEMALRWLWEQPGTTRPNPYTGEPEPFLTREQLKKVRFRIDVGMGVGPIDVLRRRGWTVIGVDNGKRPTARGKRENYASLGTELWIETSEQFRRADKPICLGRLIINGRPVNRAEGDQALIEQLCTRPVIFSTNDSGRRRILPKEEMRSTLGGSPDRADAFILAFGDITRMQPMLNIEDSMV